MCGGIEVNAERGIAVGGIAGAGGAAAPTEATEAAPTAAVEVCCCGSLRFASTIAPPICEAAAGGGKDCEAVVDAMA